MEKPDPRHLKSGEVPEGRDRVPHILQVRNLNEFLERIPGEKMHHQAGEDSLSLALWEAQWQEFLRSVENLDSPWKSQRLPEKPSPWKDAKTFLGSFEQVAEACQWPREEWVTQLMPALSGEATKAFNSLNGPDRKDYGKVKAAILRGDALSREKQREQFRLFCYQEAEGPRGAYSRLQEMCHGWLRLENHSKEQIVELLILEQLLNVLPSEMQSRVRESGPESCSQVVALAEEYLLSLEKQVPLEVVAGSISEAVRAPSQREQRLTLMDVKEEEDGEAGFLAGIEEKARDLQGSFLESIKEEYSEGNFTYPDGIKRNEGNNTDKRSDKPLPCQGGGLCEITVQEERPIHCKEKESGSPAFGKTFIQKMNIVSLEELRPVEKPYYCLECGKSFSRQTALTSHQRNHSGYQNMEDEKLHQLLPEKGKNQEWKGNLWNQSGHKREKGSCLVDKRSQSNTSQVFCEEIHRMEDITSHPRIHSGGDQENDDEMHCLPLSKANSEEMKGSSRNLVGAKGDEGSHLIKKRKQPTPCQEGNFCGQTQTATEIYKCLECGKDFSDQPRYKTHLRLHSGKKSLQCSTCGKSFSCRSKLLRHQVIHTPRKAYSCSSCGRSFSRKSSFIQHQLIHSEKKPFAYSGSGIKGYKCFQCRQYFTGKTHLLVHQRTHTGEKPFECSECGKKFSQRGNLQLHLRTHTGEKPFECSECGKKFSQRGNLQRHQGTHMRRNSKAAKLVTGACYMLPALGLNTTPELEPRSVGML